MSSLGKVWARGEDGKDKTFLLARWGLDSITSVFRIQTFAAARWYCVMGWLIS